MNLFKRILCGFLAALLLLSACACAETTDPADNDTGAQSSAEETAEETLGEPLEIADTRYDGKELVFLTREQAEWTTREIYAEKENFTESNISEAVYKRNDKILQNYGVTIKEFKVPVDNQNGEIQKAVTAGGASEFQAVISPVWVATSATTNGLIWNLNSVETSSLDFSKSWWDSKLIEGTTLNDMAFFATGDLLTADNDATFVMMFNKKIAEENNLPNLYQMVENKEWTFDKLYEYEQLPVFDKGGDGKLDFDTDVAGFAMTDDVYYSLLYAGGVTVVSKDKETGDPVYALDVEKAQLIAEKARQIFANDLIINLTKETSASMKEVGQTCFGEGHALFLGEVLQCVERMRGYDVDFGVLPYPLYDTDQASYYHMMHTTGSVVSIPRNIKSDIEYVSSMIEAMAYHSKTTLTRQYYEVNLTTKYAKDKESGPMIDLILETRVFDLAYYYSWGNVVSTVANALHAESNTSVASSSKKFNSNVNSLIKRTLSTIEKKYK